MEEAGDLALNGSGLNELGFDLLAKPHVQESLGRLDVWQADSEDLDGELFESTTAGSQNEIVALVLMEMFLSFIGILSNLLVVTTVRHHDQLMNSTTNLLLLNLCFSNLLISFLVKPISAIYSGYSISTGTWQVSLVFCSVYTLMYRTTWCILPFTIMYLSWIHIIPLCFKDKCRKRTSTNSTPIPPPSPASSNFRASPQSSTPSQYYPGTLSPEPAPLSPDTKRRLAELSNDVSMKQKFSLFTMWSLAAFFGLATCFPEKIFGVEILRGSDLVKEIGTAKDEELQACRVKTGLNDFLDYISISVCLLLPNLLGPGLLLILSPFINFQRNAEAPRPILITGLTVTYVFSYTLHMIISETIVFNNFVFLIIKNLIGFLFLVFVPVLVIVIQKDIRKGLRPIFQSKIICPLIIEEAADGSSICDSDHPPLTNGPLLNPRSGALSPSTQS